MPALPRQPTMLPSRDVPGYDRAVLVTGPASLRHEPDPSASAAATLAVAVPADRQPRNTIVLDLSHLSDLPPGGRDQAPLFVLSPAGDGWQPYTLLSFTGTDALLIALDGPPAEGDPRDPQVVNQWVVDLAARHRAHAAGLNNHQRWFVNARPGLEIERIHPRRAAGHLAPGRPHPGPGRRRGHRRLDSRARQQRRVRAVGLPQPHLRDRQPGARARLYRVHPGR